MPRKKSTKRAGQLVGNIGVPITLSEVNVHGVAAEACRKGETAKIWTRLAVTSDDVQFHRVAQNLVSVLTLCASRDGKAIALDRAHTVLLVMKKDNSAELWVDTAAVSINILMKYGAEAGSVVFEGDIADVTGMDFPLVEIGAEDRVLCLFREKWRFGLIFDFNPKGEFDRAAFSRDLGALYRVLRYRHLYEALGDEQISQRLLDAGWFPFAEIISEIEALIRACEAGFDLADEEQALIGRFDLTRLEKMFARWMTKPHLHAREQVLRTAVDCYLAQQPVATIKVVLTEIEGALADAYRAVHGRSAKLKRLLEFAIEAATARAGGSNTLLFPRAFGDYLTAYTFANFNPRGPRGNAGSRHAVGHGAAEPNSYTMTRALQALLTLDQLAFYTA